MRFEFPGGKPVAVLLSCTGFTTTILPIGLSLVSSEEEANKLLAVSKVVGITAFILISGALIYRHAKRKSELQDLGLLRRREPYIPLTTTWPNIPRSNVVDTKDSKWQ
jgi:hypothetical protein